MSDQSTVLADVRRGMIPAHIYNDARSSRWRRSGSSAGPGCSSATNPRSPRPATTSCAGCWRTRSSSPGTSRATVRAHFNMCLHRGMQVCRAEMGNASHFRCPYHGWSYRNDGRLIGLPFHQDAYGGDAGFRRKGQRLLPAPRLDSYNGLIFITWTRTPPPLADFLGDFTLLPGLLHQAERQRHRAARAAALADQGELEDRRRELRRRHVPHAADAHASVVEIGLFREPKAEKRKDGATYWARQRRRHHLQAAAGRLRRADALRRLPAGDDRPDEEDAGRRAAAGHRRRTAS